MKKTIGKRVLSILLCLVMVASYLPAGMITAVAEGTWSATVQKVVDPSTKDDWVKFFGDGTGTISTENAGGVWTDKSVFANANAFTNIEYDSRGNRTSVTMKDDNGLLVALSAMASNMSVTGQSSVPTDTMLVLDVSGSMNDNWGNNDVAQELADAANATIYELLTANSSNRVGVVLYSGPRSQNGAASDNDAVLLLPLGRYTTDDDGKFVAYSKDDGDEIISLDQDVRTAGTNPTKPRSNSKVVEGATYIQKGVILAMDQFTPTSNQTTINGVTRKPILVLMSDGAPTVSSTNFRNPTSYDLGSGSGTSAAQGFVTQLSCAYAKAMVENKYGTDMLFYTLGLGVDNDSVATSVLDPANSANAINNFWQQYNRANVNGTVTVQGSGSSAKRVTKISTALDQEYVDKYFEVRGSSNLAQGLLDAFKQIVGDIQLQSKYYPTLVGTNDELSGYISFVDRIGSYMSVTDVKGILLHNQLFSGADMAHHFVEGGGSLGTVENPTPLGDELVFAVRERLGLADNETARTLIGLAYQYGQLGYTNENNFSNYIGWYANAAGEFLGFYHEGVTTLPEATGNAATDPAFTVKSYGYLGDTDPAHGVAASDMMYATVQVRHNIATGEELVTFAIPAALIPLITYEVTLDENGDLEALDQTGADYPIRLLYEVGLDPHINELNVMDLVSEEYLTHTNGAGENLTVNADGSINFYSNKFDMDGQTGYGTNNTYSYFNPSRQNDKYYYTENAPVYRNNQGNLYTGNTHPSEYNGTLYRSYVVYEKNGNQLNKRTIYRPLSEQARATARSAAGSWYIAEGNIHVNLDGYIIEKTPNNPTGTLKWSNEPFVDASNHTVDDTGYNFVVGASLGNNGKLTLMPATGIKLTKTMAENVAAPSDSFTFAVEILNASFRGTYDAILEDADGMLTDTSVSFSNGQATVELKAGHSLYIVGLPAGTQLKITETETSKYVVASVTGGTGNTTTVTVVENRISAVEFVNTERSKGNLMITKEVTHAQAGYTVPASVLQSQTFPITVTVPAELAGADIIVNDGTGDVAAKVPAGGVFNFNIKHSQTIAIKGLPEGTEAFVTENTNNFPSYITLDRINSRDHSGATLENNGDVTIGSDTNSTVTIHNEYDPVDTSAELSVTVNKNFVIESPLSQTATFTFKLQQYVDGGWTDIDSGSITYNGDSGIKSITLPNALDSIVFTRVGDYAYQIIEEIPADAYRLPGVSYDRTTHTFSVHVTDNGGQLVATVMNNGVAVGDTHEVTFTNTYHTAPVSIDVVKEVPSLTDFPELTKTGFAFEAYKANSDWTLADETAAMTVLSDAAGEARFADTYNAVGTHYFVIKEANSGKAGWSYDATEYRVTVEIAEETDGNLAAEMTILKVTTDDTDAEVIETVTGNTITFTNHYTPTTADVDLDTTVKKNLTGRPLKAGEFTFAVFADGQASHTSTQGALSVGTNDLDGNVDFDKSLTFDKIGTYKYDIVEITGPQDKGITYSTRIYDMVVEVTDNGTGVLTATRYFEDAIGQTVTFYNTYSTSNATYAVSGTKKLNGRPLLNDEFTFEMVEVADVNGTPLTDGKTWTTTNTRAGTFSFPAITYSTEGTHYYKVTEKQTGGADYGISYDESVYIVTVEVTDNGLGELVTKGFVNGDENGTIAFENNYVPAEVSDAIPGLKTLNGKSLGANIYGFQLYNSNASWENLGAEGEPVSHDADGNFQFPAITYTTAGSYYYLVREVNGGQTIDGVIYDNTTFRVLVEVTDDLRGQLHAETVVFDENNIPQIGVEFVNVYQVTGDRTLILEGSKTYNKPLADGDFTFELYETDASYTISGTPIQTATNQSGQFSFRLDYTAENGMDETFYYVVREKNAGQRIDGIAYSSQTYNLSVRVYDNGSGQLVMVANAPGLNPSTANNVTVLSGMSFTNTYSADPTDTIFKGTKALEADGLRDLKANDFTFQLFKTNAQFVVQGAAVQSVKNDANGDFSFAEESFDTADTYYFIVKEDSSAATGGIIYDSTVYQITVTVIDDGKGQLQVESTTYTKVTSEGTTSADSIAFQNTYDPADATVSFSGSKSFNKTFGADKFSFVLSTTNAEFIDNGSADPIIVKNAADGTFTFGTKTFSRPGTYYFQIKEVNGGEIIDGITHDGTKYNITVKVEDDGDGKLIPTVTVNNSQATVAVDGTNATVTNVKFQNTYAAAATTPMAIFGSKTVDGQWTLQQDDFTFQLFKADAQFVIQGAAVQSVKNDVNGDFKFENITLDTAGDHYFVIKETSENPINGMTYDPTVYHVTIKVKDDGLGQLVVDPDASTCVKVTAEGSAPAEQILFANSYDAEDTTLSLSGKKKLEGKDLTAGEFTFALQETDDKFAALAGTLPKQTVNTADGTFTFDALTYDKAGTYYYTVTELDTGNERTAFDKTVYNVTVTVTDENGVLKAKATYATENASADELVFTNIYTPKPADLPLQITVQKTVKNTGTQKIGPEGFTFVLEESADSKIEATTDKDGKAAFALTVTEDMIGETYTLKLYEKNDAKANVTYSNAVYEYVIKVSLGSDNKLVADITCNGKTADTGKLVAEFENVYNYTPPATPYTGDNMNPIVWFSLLAVSAIALAAAFIFRKKIMN